MGKKIDKFKKDKINRIKMQYIITVVFGLIMTIYKIKKYYELRSKLIRLFSDNFDSHSHKFLYVLEKIKCLEVFYDEHLYRAPLRRQFEKESKKLDSLICVDCGNFKNTHIPLDKAHRCKHTLRKCYWITREFISI